MEDRFQLGLQQHRDRRLSDAVGGGIGAPAQHHRGERLVHLERIDDVDRQTRARPAPSPG
jgi:hypothetical protein